MMAASLILSCLVLSFCISVAPASKLSLSDDDKVLNFVPFGGDHSRKSSVEAFPFRNVSLPWDVRVDDLVSRLSIEELINQTVARYGMLHFTPGINHLGIHPIQYITECLRGVHKENATGFPQALGLAASFSRELIFRVSEAVGMEVRAFYNDAIKQKNYGLHGLTCFSPVINILRHPLWGRNQETYGEDPFLSGELSVQYVSGIQGNHSRYLRVSSGCKHFDAHGGPDTIPVRKFGFNAKIKERDLQMTFLPQFKACMRAKPYNVMCSFNSINGVPSCANKRLLTDILRRDWGYKGFVVSDDAAVEYIYTEHHYNSSFEAAAVEAVRAGCNMALVGKFDPSFWTLKKAIADGLMTKKDLEDNARPVFLTRFLLGEFDPPSMNPYNSVSMAEVLSASHVQLAREAAVKSFVLMKNLNSFLPLNMKSYSHISVVGPMSNYKDGLMGDYAPYTDPALIRTPLDGFRGYGGEVQWASGCSTSVCDDYDSQQLQTAVSGAQVVFVCLGTGAIVEAENNDRAEMDLPGSQLQLLKDAVHYSHGAPVVLLLFNAGPLDITWAKLSPSVTSILECFFPSMAAGDAIYQALTNADGASVPAGRLPNTWPAQLHQVANITDYTMKGRTYRYYEEDPLYPFGYGLSYTQFKYSSLNVSPMKVAEGQDVSVNLVVTNTGSHDADEVVQVYISWPSSVTHAPRWQLAAFDRIHIAKGQSAKVRLSIEYDQLKYWVSNHKGFRVVPGDMTLYAGGQQPFQRTDIGSNVLSVQFQVLG